MSPKNAPVGNRNMGTHGPSPLTDKGYPRRPGKRASGGGVSVVVRGRESRPHGEGGQTGDTLLKPEERSVDSDHQADQAWVLDAQRKLYQWSQANPAEPYRELWNWVTDLRSLRTAWNRVAHNKGKRTPGVDGKTCRLHATCWRAGCITKGARPVRREGTRNRWSRDQSGARTLLNPEA